MTPWRGSRVNFGPRNPIGSTLNYIELELLLLRAPADTQAAEASLVRAIEIARSQRTRTFELRAALSLARLYRSTGRAEEARDLLGPALVGFTAGPEPPEVAEAERLLAEVRGLSADAAVR